MAIRFVDVAQKSKLTPKNKNEPEPQPVLQKPVTETDQDIKPKRKGGRPRKPDSEKPWVALGIHRQTYWCRKKAGKL